MAEAEARGRGSASSSGGGDGGGAAREAQRSGGGDERVTAADGGGTAYATAGMSEEEIARAIETSRQRGLFSEVPPRGLGAAGPHGGGGDAEVWEQLKRSHHRFRDMREGELKLGRMIGEGGQAQIYHASLNGDDEYVAKVFKMEGFSLAELQRQWPRVRAEPLPTGLDAGQDNPVGLGRTVFCEIGTFISWIYGATFVEDGRFAFVMHRYWGDLRTLIDLRLKDNSQGPLFSHEQAIWIMLSIARGMKELHDLGVLHRDLKAANVLVRASAGVDIRYVDDFDCDVADYESAMLVVGTGFWRAPEVLEELMKQPCDRGDDIWTKKVDAYSYAMTCYEVLTGHIPFHGYTKKDWKRVIDGERPHLPDYVDPRVRDLVGRCWHMDPSKRPSFATIISELSEIRWH